MHIIQARNVHEAYVGGLRLLREYGETGTMVARDGQPDTELIVVPSPVVTITERPQERVLHLGYRDANPFFHLFESLWMLGGRDDATFLNQFVRDFGDRFAQPGTDRIHGAYGRRWRSWFDKSGVVGIERTKIDQLEEAVRLLRAEPTSRQVVIQMWDAEQDLGVESLRDRPCNTQVYLRVRRHQSNIDKWGNLNATLQEDRDVLDLTVTCRSNDVVWGAHGANAVQFSVLQEYLAARIGIGVGRMYQFSNNYHGYRSVLERVAWTQAVALVDNPYERGTVSVTPMFTSPDKIDEDLAGILGPTPLSHIYHNDWFRTVAVPMLGAHMWWRRGDVDTAMRLISDVSATDWRLAAQQWIQRRIEKRSQKNG